MSLSVRIGLEDRGMVTRKKSSTEILFSLGVLLRSMSLKGYNEYEEGLIFLWDLFKAVRF